MTELQSCKRAKLFLTEMHTPYIVSVCVPTAVAVVVAVVVVVEAWRLELTQKVTL